MPADCEHRVPAARARARDRETDAVAGTEPQAATGVRFPLCRTRQIPGGRDDVWGTAGSGRSQPLPKSFGTGAACGICHYFQWQFVPPPAAMVTGAGVSTAVGPLLGFRPACRASRSDSVFALEGS